MLKPVRNSLTLLLCVCSVAIGQDVVTGTLTVVWDGNSKNGSTAQYYLTDDRGAVTEIDAASSGNNEMRLQSYDRSRIEMSLGPSRSVGTGLPLRTMLSFHGTGSPPLQNLFAVVTPKPWVFLLCRFSDDPTTPFTKQQVERVVGSTYPGVANFYAELSEDPSIMSGNRVVDWMTLQKPRSAYINDAAFSTNTSDLANDCAAAADAEVDFTQYQGIAFQMNGALSRRNVAPFDTLSLGGSVFLSVDGQTRVWGAAWFSASHMGNWVVYHHEIGHGFGWPHSSGKYGREYDSQWDLMSVGYLNFTPAFGWLPIHTIMPYKKQAGWIPADRILVTQAGTSTTGIITRSALGGSTGYRLAQIPISDTSEYIVEARRLAGYDAALPAEAVLIHEVIRRRAYVVDPDNNGDPNDESAIWRPGESFVDGPHKITVSVVSAASSGFNVSIQRGVASVAIVSTSARKSGVVSVAYADTLAATGGVGVFAWSVISGSLPDGLSLNVSSGVVSGTPSRGGQFAFVIRATSAGESGDKAFSLTVFNPVVILSDSTRRLGVTGTAYADTLGASGGSGTFNWSVASGTVPPGLSLSSTSGTISGNPSTVGDFRFTVSATSAGLTATKQLHVVVTAPLTIVSQRVRRSGVVSVPYADTLATTGGFGVLTWSVIDGRLPDGLSLSAAGGTISGTPTRAGQFAFAIRATATGLVAEQSFNTIVFDVVGITSDSTRRMGLVGTSYADTLIASGGAGTFNWSVPSSTVPPGLSLSSTSGIISGNPSSAGDFRFTVSATSAGMTATKQLHVVVAAAIQATPLIDQILGVGAMSPDQMRYLDLGGNRNGRLDVGDVRAWLISTNQLSANGSVNEAASNEVKRLGARVLGAVARPRRH